MILLKIRISTKAKMTKNHDAVVFEYQIPQGDQALENAKSLACRDFCKPDPNQNPKKSHHVVNCFDFPRGLNQPESGKSR